MLTILGFLLISAGITILRTHEEPSNDPISEHPENTMGEEAIGLTNPRGYWWLIAERAAFLFGVYGLQAFGQYYLQDVLQVPDPARQAGKLLAFVGMGTIVLVMAGGWLADRFEPGVKYTEREVNALLNQWHTFGDPVTLRRELYDDRRIDRTRDGARYWLVVDRDAPTT